jgi:Amt family ammonium transporter
VHALCAVQDCIPGQTIPHLLFAAFQMTFALMVPVLITGAWAEKFHFFSACQFMVIWPVLVYYPTAHWIWGGGWLAKDPYNENDDGRAVDYAGGVVIHTSAGVASLVVRVPIASHLRTANSSVKCARTFQITLVVFVRIHLQRGSKECQQAYA